MDSFCNFFLMNFLKDRVRYCKVKELDPTALKYKVKPVTCKETNG
jgi:hypothetical protein